MGELGNAHGVGPVRLHARDALTRQAATGFAARQLACRSIGIEQSLAPCRAVADRHRPTVGRRGGWR